MSRSLRKGRTDWAQRHVDFYATDQGQRVLEEEVAMLLPHLPYDGRLLSVGCGVCAHEVLLVAERPMLELVSLDVDESMLAHCPGVASPVLGDATAMPFPEDSFDAVIFVTSLDFMDTPWIAMVEATRVLRPGGSLVIMTFDPTTRWGRERLKDRQLQWSDAASLRELVKAHLGVDVATKRGVEIDGEKTMILAWTVRRNA